MRQLQFNIQFEHFFLFFGKLNELLFATNLQKKLLFMNRQSTLKLNNNRKIYEISSWNTLVMLLNNRNFENFYEWVRERKQNKNIKHVFNSKKNILKEIYEKNFNGTTMFNYELIFDGRKNEKKMCVTTMESNMIKIDSDEMNLNRFTSTNIYKNNII